MGIPDRLVPSVVLAAALAPSLGAQSEDRSVRATESVRTGMPANPPTLTTGLTSAPVEGQTWDPVVVPTLPDATQTWILASNGPANLPLAGIGTLLCDLQNVEYFMSAPGIPFSIAIPPGLAGRTFCTQGLELGAGGGLTVGNAVDIQVGSLGTPAPAFRILTCSQVCISDGLGTQVVCDAFTLPAGAEVRVAFSHPVQLSSVDLGSFRVTNVATGGTPPGSFALDPTDPRILIYRPQLVAGGTYQVFVPGTNQDLLGPYVTSTDGISNQDRLACVLVGW